MMHSKIAKEASGLEVTVTQSFTYKSLKTPQGVCTLSKPYKMFCSASLILYVNMFKSEE